MAPTPPNNRMVPPWQAQDPRQAQMAQAQPQGVAPVNPPQMGGAPTPGPGPMGMTAPGPARMVPPWQAQPGASPRPTYQGAGMGPGQRMQSQGVQPPGPGTTTRQIAQQGRNQGQNTF